jgi:hypothetical protein
MANPPTPRQEAPGSCGSASVRLYNVKSNLLSHVCSAFETCSHGEDINQKGYRCSMRWEQSPTDAGLENEETKLQSKPKTMMR